MRISHIALYVDDLEAAKLFFMRYFQATANEGYHNPTTGLSTYFLSFLDGARIEIMHRNDMVENEKHIYRSGYCHLAFSVGSQEAVDTLTNRLCLDGYTVLSGPRNTGDGYYESCVLDGEGNQIEITI
ncbi:VOC family protein [Anaerotignum sp.]|uniref:VOC family protein n=1 Tax=Anaerotignum sp. TaxID=2039241 RepID=UPI00332A1B41